MSDDFYAGFDQQSFKIQVCPMCRQAAPNLQLAADAPPAPLTERIGGRGDNGCTCALQVGDCPVHDEAPAPADAPQFTPTQVEGHADALELLAESDSDFMVVEMLRDYQRLIAPRPWQE